MIDEQRLTQALDEFEAKTKGATGTDAADAAFDPCGLWHSAHDIVVEITTLLRVVGKLIPIVARLADVLTTLTKILDTLCPPK